MHYASTSDIKELMRSPNTDGQAISIFLPTHRISLPHNLKADRVRMKNAIRDVVATLEQMKYNDSDIKRHVEKLHDLHANKEFWSKRDNGLAIYATMDKLAYFDLPLEIEYSVHVNGDFIISPLLAGRADAYQYHVLELNFTQPRYFLGSQAGLEQALSDELPADLKTALHIDEYQTRRQHSTSPGGDRDAHSHGHGGRKDKQINDKDRYLRLVDKVLWENALKNSNLPLIIAADVDTASLFRERSRYRYIHSAVLEGNYQRANKDTLAEKTWEIMSDSIMEEENMFQRMLDRAKRRDGQQLLVNGAHIRKAARQGKIATLAISLIYKTYDSVVRRMEQRFKIALPSSARQLMNIEDSAREVIQTGGEVKALLHANGNNNANYVQAITRG